MNNQRYRHLMTSNDPLTEEEIEAGWIFCCEWDGLLINRNDEEGEIQSCTCYGHKKGDASIT